MGALHRQHDARLDDLMPRPIRFALAGLALATPVLAAWLLPLTAGPTLCTFRNLTGYDCPGCGLTRSVVAFVHGDFGVSLRAHPLGALVFVLFFALGGTALWSWAKGGRFVSPLGAKTPTWTIAVFVGLYLAVYVARLAGYLGGTADAPGPGLITALWR